eukprot:TRINITY_DN7189_c0_g1_i2.p1 TRINITY_DN7189_c0_g1~~TRINITY_DN7189_c0_g1_i2.p1  ORF type:complete len:187 (-),score=21.78 TRINITY_DN7189_c0_g1_i2:238-798(-)
MAVARSGNVERVKELINGGECNLNWQDEKGNTALHEAIKAGKRLAVMALLDHPNINPLLVNEEERLPIHVACLYGRVFIVQYLVKYSPECDAKDKYGNTPMILLAQGNTEKAATIAGTLINRGCEFNHVNYEGRSALHYTSLTDNKDFSRMLIEAGLSAKLCDNSGVTPIDLCPSEAHLAVLYGSS